MGAGQKGKEGASSEQSKYPSVPSLLGDFPLRFRCTIPKSPASASHRLGAPFTGRLLSAPLCPHVNISLPFLQGHGCYGIKPSLSTSFNPITSLRPVSI